MPIEVRSSLRQDGIVASGTPRLTQDTVPCLLDGLAVITQKDVELPIQICATHLAWLGASRAPARPCSERGGRDPRLAGELTLRPSGGGAFPRDGGVDCTIRWQSPHERGPKLPGTEALIQAISGLMAVHGRDQHIPRRLGLEVASVAAGIIATQGVLAALIGQSRGYRVRAVETSVLQAALLFLSHHLAITTCGDAFSFPASEPGPGPPFCTADGHWVELEVLTFDAWIGFWRQLGVEHRGLLADAWSAFVYRYLAGRCALPEALHEATRRRSLTELRRIADACGVAICRVRAYPALLAELGWSTAAGRRSADYEPVLETPWTICPGTGRPEREGVCPSPADTPLGGLRVVEVTSRLQGPLAGLLLRMLGAEVVKVEPPGGDFGRAAPPLAGALGAAYLAYNRGKQVVELNYKQPEGRARLAELVAHADVFLHNWRSGRAEQLGLDYAHLARSNPRLVYAHASGWGRTRNEPSPIAGDYLVQAYAGCGEGLNPADEPPFPSRLTLVDVTGGLLACEGLLAGLYLRERTGQGCRVDTSLLAGAMTLQAHVLRATATGQETGRHLGRPLWGLLDRPIETADGFLVVAAENEQAHRRLSELCRFGTDAEEGALEERIAERLRSRPAAEWALLLREAGIPAAAVCSDVADLPHDPRVAGFLERVNDACWMPATPWQFKP